VAFEFDIWNEPTQFSTFGTSDPPARLTTHPSPETISLPVPQIANSTGAQHLAATTYPPRAKRTEITRNHSPASSIREVVEQVYDSNPRNEYEYSKLASKDEIRLLFLQPGQESDTIECDLISTKLGPATQRYEALSYHWGPSEPKYEIRIYSYSRGTDQPSLRHITRQRFYILGELYSALKCLRDPQKTVALWVDAICVNGEDGEELNTQMSMMVDIFNGASNVCVWLGEGDSRSRVAMSMIPKVLDLVEVDDLLKTDLTLDELQAFLELTARPWFSRRWIVQEIASARSASLHCGKESIHWADFADAVALLNFKKKEVDRFVNHGLTLDVTELVKATREMVRLSENGGTVERRWDVETIVSTLTRFQVNVPHDHIYAVLCLARDCQPSVEKFATIDYSKPFNNVCKEFIDYCVKSSESLDILCRPWLSDARLNVPSWASPRHSRSAIPISESLVGLPGRKIYNASNSIPASAAFGGLSLIVHGFRLDQINYLSTPGSRLCISSTSLSMGGWYNFTAAETPTTVPDRLWRTLVADRGASGTSPPSWYHRACLHLLTQCTGPDGDVDVRALMQSSRPSAVVKFLKRVESVIWDRQFLLTVVGKFFGLAPITARSDDLICILYGCSVPVVLREHTNKRGRDVLEPAASSGSYFEFIGECYVHGVMDGQACQGELPDEVFVIR
jgi:hypothetical protein